MTTFTPDAPPPMMMEIRLKVSFETSPYVGDALLFPACKFPRPKFLYCLDIGIHRFNNCGFSRTWSFSEKEANHWHPPIAGILSAVAVMEIAECNQPEYFHCNMRTCPTAVRGSLEKRSSKSMRESPHSCISGSREHSRKFKSNCNCRSHLATRPHTKVTPDL